MVACGQPKWCDDQWTTYTNADSGYTVTYPESCSMVSSDSEYFHILFINFTDEVTQFTITVYKPFDSNSVERFFEMFKDDILSATKERPIVGYIKRYDYEILSTAKHDDVFRQINYTFTKADMDMTSGNWRETDMIGETWWVVGEYQDTEYIYNSTYETLSDCETCTKICSELSSRLFGEVFDDA